MHDTYIKSNYQIAPSLICCDLCDLKSDVRHLENLGCRMLHVDVLDGKFSPSMPIGLDTLRQLRRYTRMVYDAHVMAVPNDFYVEELIDMGAERVCFQLESQRTPGVLLRKIRSSGTKAGIALAPSTPVDMLAYMIEDCDFVLLMQIDPGYASHKGIQKPPYMLRKIRELRVLMDRYHPEATIGIDGHVDIESMPKLRDAGVSTFVSGTKGIFRSGTSWEENWQTMHRILSE